MSNVWVCFPSKRPESELEPVLLKWKKQGYRIAICRDEGEHYRGVFCDIAESLLPYPGYAASINHLVRLIFRVDHTCDWIIAAADDIWPEPNHRAEEIAEECSEHFGVVNKAPHLWTGCQLGGDPADAGSTEWVRYCKTCGMEDTCEDPLPPCVSSFGVMQPTGDSWGDKEGPYIQRVAGSPWLGREFCKRVNNGIGPLWPEYFHMFCDQELQEVAQALGCFWQRPDLTHHHQHWGRPLPGEKMAPSDQMPNFLAKANSGEEWRKAKAIFERHKAEGFAQSLILKAE